MTERVQRLVDVAKKVVEDAAHHSKYRPDGHPKEVNPAFIRELAAAVRAVENEN